MRRIYSRSSYRLGRLLKRRSICKGSRKRSTSGLQVTRDRSRPLACRRPARLEKCSSTRSAGAGVNVFGCVGVNTWALQSGGGGRGR